MNHDYPNLDAIRDLPFDPPLSITPPTNQNASPPNSSLPRENIFFYHASELIDPAPLQNRPEASVLPPQNSLNPPSNDSDSVESDLSLFAPCGPENSRKADVSDRSIVSSARNQIILPPNPSPGYMASSLVFAMPFAKEREERLSTVKTPTVQQEKKKWYESVGPLAVEKYSFPSSLAERSLPKETRGLDKSFSKRSENIKVHNYFSSNDRPVPDTAISCKKKPTANTSALRGNYDLEKKKPSANTQVPKTSAAGKKTSFHTTGLEATETEKQASEYVDSSAGLAISSWQKQKKVTSFKKSPSVKIHSKTLPDDILARKEDQSFIPATAKLQRQNTTGSRIFSSAPKQVKNAEEASLVQVRSTSGPAVSSWKKQKGAESFKKSLSVPKNQKALSRAVPAATVVVNNENSLPGPFEAPKSKQDIMSLVTFASKPKKSTKGHKPSSALGNAIPTLAVPPTRTCKKAISVSKQHSIPQQQKTMSTSAPTAALAPKMRNPFFRKSRAEEIQKPLEPTVFSNTNNQIIGARKTSSKRVIPRLEVNTGSPKHRNEKESLQKVPSDSPKRKSWWNRVPATVAENEKMSLLGPSGPVPPETEDIFDIAIPPTSSKETAKFPNSSFENLDTWSKSSSKQRKKKISVIEAPSGPQTRINWSKYIATAGSGSAADVNERNLNKRKPPKARKIAGGKKSNSAGILKKRSASNTRLKEQKNQPLKPVEIIYLDGTTPDYLPSEKIEPGSNVQKGAVLQKTQSNASSAVSPVETDAWLKEARPVVNREMPATISVVQKETKSQNSQQFKTMRAVKTAGMVATPTQIRPLVFYKNDRILSFGEIFKPRRHISPLAPTAPQTKATK